MGRQLHDEKTFEWFIHIINLLYFSVHPHRTHKRQQKCAKVTNDCFLTIQLYRWPTANEKGRSYEKSGAYLHKTCAETTIAYPRERLKFQQKRDCAIAPKTPP
ncbi:MAG: hypothetical protein ACLR1P_10060 [Oscillospiraceae bacterium]